MLEQISFSLDDHLYIIGDVLDRGAHPFTLLRRIMQMNNVTCLIGNHDWFFLHIAAHRLGFETEEASSISIFYGDVLFQNWKDTVGEPTSREFLALTPQERQEVVDYIKAMPRYLPVFVGGKEYVLVHAGLQNFAEEKPLAAYSDQELLEIRTNTETKYFTDKTVIVGHTPTFYIDPACRGRIYHGTGCIIDVDCGACYPERGGRLGCLRLDDFAEFYI